MPDLRRLLRRTSQAAVLLALGTGLSQGTSVIAGYITGQEGRALAVLAAVGAASAVVVLPAAFEENKKIF